MLGCLGTENPLLRPPASSPRILKFGNTLANQDAKNAVASKAPRKPTNDAQTRKHRRSSAREGTLGKEHTNRRSRHNIRRSWISKCLLNPNQITAQNLFWGLSHACHCQNNDIRQSNYYEETIVCQTCTINHSVPPRG